MVAAISVFRLMENHRILYFYTAGGEVTLEIIAVILSIPETPLSEGEEGEGFGLASFVGEDNLLNLAVEIYRYKEGCFCF